MSPLLRLVVATRNRGKLVELHALLSAHLSGVALELLSLDQAGVHQDAVEDGLTFADNARKKAFFAAEQSGLLALADDSGLEVQALGGAPGVHSARYAGRHGDDEANRQKLLAALAGVAPPRRARFCCALALAQKAPAAQPGTGSDLLALELGECPGEIALAPAGSGGFGYDPLFYLPELDRTMAQPSPEEKNRLSHRGKAMLGMAQQIAVLLPKLLQGRSE